MNENWITNLFRMNSPLFNQQTDSTTPEAETSLDDIRTRARAMVFFRGITTLTATSCTYDSNFVIDGYSHYSSASTVQSNGILIEDLELGILDLSSSTFTGNKGILTNNRAGIYPQPLGFSSRLIAFNRVVISTLTFDSVEFHSNMGE